ncbi:MAG: depupylase/deamidase Dop [Acidimicrobiia bacterium]
MAIPKVCGIETEYGIVLRGADDNNPVSASSLLINAYVARLAGRIGWDFEDENPAKDAREAWLDVVFPPEVETHLVNAVLTNGARYYVDHAHPEISTPECLDAYEVVTWDRGSEEILLQSMAAAQQTLPAGAEIVVYKNNSDGKGNSYGCHENYLMDRAIPFPRIVQQITPHFVTRQVFAGAGKVGCELSGVGIDDVPFQLSQRADFFEEEVGLETTLKRPIVNTRDEPHCDASKYRRLHVIVGDANMSEVATYLKVGTTAIVLAMIEDDAYPSDLVVHAPVRTIKEISWDPTLRTTLGLTDGRRLTALDVQWMLLEAAKKWERSHGLASVGEDVGRDVLARWESVLTGLESDPMSMASMVDWVAKRRILDGLIERHGLTHRDAKLRAVDLQYHDLRPGKSLARRAGLDTVAAEPAWRRSMTEPPPTTRAYFRGRCLAKYPDQIVAANWDSMVFDVGSDPLRRVPMMEPLRGTAAVVGSLIDECSTAQELLGRLGA